MDLKNREVLRKEMFAAHEKQKILSKQLDLLLKNDEKENALKAAHEIAQLQDFIKMTESKLKLTD